MAAALSPAAGPVPAEGTYVTTSERCSCGGATEPLHSTLEPLKRCLRCGAVTSSLPDSDAQRGTPRLALVPREDTGGRDDERRSV